MTAADLADLNGLLALAAAVRAKAGDRRDKSIITDEILEDAGAPDIKAFLGRLVRLCGAVVLAIAICAPPPPSDEACHLGPPLTYCDAASAGLGG